VFVSATDLNAVSTVRAVANRANCRVSELVGQAAYTDWYWRRNDVFTAAERGRQH
jgi:hypothetical protein